jgi:hypothetical protein
MHLNIFIIAVLELEMEEAPPLQVVREGATTEAKEPAQGALGSLGTAG